MSVNIFKQNDYDDYDINTNIPFYYSNKVNNGYLKLKSNYPHYFLPDDNNEIKYFQFDPFNTRKFVVFGDSLSNNSSITWCSVLENKTGKTKNNLFISASPSNDAMMVSTNANTILLDTNYRYISSIIYYGFNDQRSASTRTLYNINGNWEYQKMLIDLYASASLPQSLIVKARDMSVVSGSFTTTNAFNNLATSTNTLDSTLRYNFVNKRYIYISFHHTAGKVDDKWEIYCNNVLQCSEYNTSVLSINSSFGTTTYAGGLFIDMKTNQNIQLDIKYKGATSAEYNFCNYCCGYNLDDIKTAGRNVLAMNVANMNSIFITSANYNDLNETKRIMVKNAIIDAVYTCQMYNLNVFYLETPEYYPLTGNNSFATSSQNQITNSILKYININNLVS
jgi:hypothetical protein